MVLEAAAQKMALIGGAFKAMMLLVQ